MPTTSVAGTLVLTNFDEVTTTFTAPDSCATVWKNGIHGLLGGILFPAGHCGGVRYQSECYPHGDKLVDNDSSVIYSATNRQNSTKQHYFSPASNCPAGWTTVGMAAMDDGTASVNGIFSPTRATNSIKISGHESIPAETHPPVNFVPNMITSALGPQETAVICCPSGHSANPYQPGCTSTFPASSLSDLDGCLQFHTGMNSETSLSASTQTWDFEGQTFTEIKSHSPEPTDLQGDMASEQFKFDARGYPTSYGNGTLFDDWLEEGNDGEGFVLQPWLVYIHNVTDDGQGGDDDSAASSATYSLFAMAATLLAGVALAVVL